MPLFLFHESEMVPAVEVLVKTRDFLNEEIDRRLAYLDHLDDLEDCPACAEATNPEATNPPAASIATPNSDPKFKSNLADPPLTQRTANATPRLNLLAGAEGLGTVLQLLNLFNKNPGLLGELTTILSGAVAKTTVPTAPGA